MMNRSQFYIANEQPRYLNRLDSAKLIVPSKDHHLLHVASRLADSTRIGIDTNVPNQFLLVRGDSNKLEEVQHYSDVYCTRNAYLDEEGYEVILTNDILVKFTKNMSENEKQDVCKKLNCVLLEDGEFVSKIRVLDQSEDAPLEVANKLYEEKYVEFAEPNMLRTSKVLSTPEDVLFSKEWHLLNTGQADGKKGADVNVMEAWEITKGSPEISVVVHDSGVDINHPDLRDNITNGWDFDNKDSDASNPNGPHGTACAGIIAGVENGKGIVGVAPKCKITPLRAAGSHPTYTWGETFLWAAKHGDIISCSWSIGPSDFITSCINEVATNGRSGKGIPIFCATGNDGVRGIAYPASLPKAIAVGASTNKDVISSYSQYGKGIDFVAPSSPWTREEGTLRIETTDVRGSDGYNTVSGEKGDYCNAEDHTGFGGTSSATPLAAGVAALMLSANPNLTSEQVRQFMRETCAKIDQNNGDYNESGWSDKYGYGRIDAGKAVKKARNL
ncbi:S8 family serine peptidase [Bacillus atrophaeus]|uniref:S8 family peptidase n=2 Tax=Bacillus atrophaeus TaxID=1452 RepID=UPI0022802A36|nr:S8 family serine peptidase [Bacillus atrophaeus]MCY8823194.1 S8 family serine peptidase [Bacillus atrophaeus]MEC0802618.1 S8 family serine peptidase [Bacillus atrophaeus]MEC0816345.1 S8 family serine peptidase [Bacillus atrophaeus]MEC0939834.1 S8 family serine peptidase [Bacillus atrophaeus]